MHTICISSADEEIEVSILKKCTRKAQKIGNQWRICVLFSSLSSHKSWAFYSRILNRHKQWNAIKVPSIVPNDTVGSDLADGSIRWQTSRRKAPASQFEGIKKRS